LTKGPQWMPLNVSDYLRDTTHLSAAEHGAYCLLIMHYWKDGGLPESEDFIRRLTHLSAELWIESRPVLAALFDEGWKHKRIDAELTKAAELISKRSARAVHQHSRRRADAEPDHSTSSDTRVPPSPLPEQDITAPPVLEPQGARDLFLELVEAFPANPTASETKARKAWDRLKPAERVDAVAAAERYSRWFAQDCEARGRTIDAGLHFVPHLSTWLDSGQWREASKLPIRGEADPDMVVIVKGDDDFAALERHRGKTIRVFSDDGRYTVAKSELEQARAGVMH
jgi:uncharacterized protein YdaU (DUF1376 family)